MSSVTNRRVPQTAAGAAVKLCVIASHPPCARYILHNAFPGDRVVSGSVSLVSASISLLPCLAYSALRVPSRADAMWWPFQWLVIYVIGGVTFVPLVVVAVICKSEASLASLASLASHRRLSMNVFPEPVRADGHFC